MDSGSNPERRGSEKAPRTHPSRRMSLSSQALASWPTLRPRFANRHWTEEFDELTEKGFVWHFDRQEWAMARSTFCVRCGDEMELRGFERGDLAYRAYALCLYCGWWIEF